MYKNESNNIGIHHREHPNNFINKLYTSFENHVIWISIEFEWKCETFNGSFDSPSILFDLKQFLLFAGMHNGLGRTNY